MTGARLDWWTEPRIAILCKSWVAGASAAEIAAELGDGATRSAVIGKARRLKLPAHSTAVKRQNLRRAMGLRMVPGGKAERRIERAARPPKSPKHVPAPILAIAGNGAAFEKPPGQAPRTPESFNPGAWAPLAGSAPIPLLALNSRTCKWPVSVEGAEEHMFCGCLKSESAPYCLAHDEAERARSAKQNGRPLTISPKNAEKLAKRWAA